MFQKNIIDNILLSGYLREHEKIFHVEIPNLVTSVISVYCKQYYVKTIGSSKEDCCSDTIYSSICSEYKVFKTNSNDLSTPNHSALFEHIFAAQNAKMPQKIDDLLDCGYFHDTYNQIIDIQYGEEQTLFLTLTGNVYAFGSNINGECGLGQTIKYIKKPTLIPFETPIRSIACGKLHSLFININGELLVCGFNYSGQLGIKLEKQNVLKYSDDINDGEYSECNDTSESIEDIIDDNNNPFSFIDISDDEDVDDNFDATKYCNIYEPVLNPYFDDLNIRFMTANCGAYHSLCISTDGECYTFGDNDYGNLGNGKCEQSDNIPYKLDINKRFVHGSCGNNHNILITENNEIVVFGDNTKNQCSMMDKDIIDIPLILSKQKEFEIAENCYIEKVITINNTSLFIIDINKRIYNVNEWK